MNISVPVKNIGEYIIKTLTKLDNGDELTLYLDTKRHDEIIDFENIIRIYRERRVAQFTERMNQIILTNFSHLKSKYNNLGCYSFDYDMCGFKLDWNENYTDLYRIKWLKLPQKNFKLYVMGDMASSEYNFSLDKRMYIPLEFKPLLEYIIDEAAKL